MIKGQTPQCTMLSADYFTKQWYILWKGKKEGLYSCAELKCDSRVTPDTLVWKEGFKDWVPAREIRELEILFEEPQELNAPLSEALPSLKGEGTLVLEEQEVIPPFWWWLLIVATILIGIFFFNHETR